MLFTDWSAPGTLVLRRLSDKRALHFWDKDHVVANEMGRDARPPQPTPHCCQDKGLLWDLAAVYPKGVTWGASMPSAVVFDGPVYQTRLAIEQAVANRN